MHHHHPRLEVPRVAAALIACLIVMSAAVVRAQGAPPGMAAMRTAEQHAGLAASATQLAAVQLHLHHVLNCLEGKSGKDYSAAAGDPCKGPGALTNLTAGSADRVRAEKAIRLAAVGVTFHDFKPAHYVALAVQAVLQEATGGS